MFTWTDQSVTEFIAAITDELIRTGANADNGLKKQQWTSVLTKFNENRAVKADKDQLQSKYQMLKKKYTAFKVFYRLQSVLKEIDHGLLIGIER